MADNIKVLGSVDVSAVNVATNEIGGVHYPVYKISYGIDGVQVPVSDTNKLPVIGPLTDTELRASAIPVTGPLTDTELRASSVAVTGPLTDAELRSSAVPVSGPITDTELRATPVNVLGPLTDTELRASDVPVTVSGGSLGSGGLTLDAWGIQKFSRAQSLFHSKWTFNVDSRLWFMYENGTQVYTSTDVTSASGAGKLLSTATNTTVTLESRESPRYQPNRGHLYSTALWCPNKTNGTKREWGLFTTENGVFFRLKNDGLLYAVVRSNSIDTEVLIDTSSITGFDVEKGFLYDIGFQWRGVGDYFFYINQTLVHTVANLGTLTELSIQNPALPSCYNAVGTVGSFVEMNIGCVDITSENGDKNDREVYQSAFSENVSVSTDTPVLVVQQPLQINSTTNTRTMTLARVTVHCTKKAVFKVWLTRDPTAITGATFQSLPNGSYVQTDSTDMNPAAVRATSVTTASLSLVTAISTSANQEKSIDNPYRDRIEFPVVRGDYLLVTCTAATASADCVIEWGEQV